MDLVGIDPDQHWGTRGAVLDIAFALGGAGVTGGDTDLSCLVKQQERSRR